MLEVRFWHANRRHRWLRDVREGTIQLPTRAKDSPDQERLALRFERLKPAAAQALITRSSKSSIASSALVALSDKIDESP
jgi:hypothetical protein